VYTYFFYFCRENMINFFRQFLVILAGTLLLMLPAFYNHYPIVFSDSGTYLSSGFDMSFPIDRPIAYGVFVRLSSLHGVSTWLVIFVQSLILSYVLFLCMKMVLGEKFRYITAFVIYLFLSVFSSAAWTSSMIMTDVFTPIGILSGSVIVFGNVKKGTLVLLYCIFLLASATHFSHILIFSVLFAFVFVFRKWFLPKNQYPYGFIRAIGLIATTLVSIFIMRPSLNRGKSIMYTGTMLSQGIAQEYLNDYCGTKHFMLCRYKDSLLPARMGEGTWFEYNPNSPLHGMSGWTDSMRDECSEIMYGTFTKPKYIWLHIVASLKWSFVQLYSFTTGGGNGPYMDEYPILANIRCHFKSELSEYANSKQSKSTLLQYYYPWNDILTITIIVSLLILVLFFLFRRSIYNGHLGHFTIVLLLGIILNAWDCGTFSDINLRYGSRVMWVVPFLACLAVTRFFNKNKPDETVKIQ
jgi:hypothetical protein